MTPRPGPSRSRPAAQACPFCAFGHEPGFEHAPGACVRGGAPTPLEALPDLDPRALESASDLQEQGPVALAALGRLDRPYVRRAGERVFRPAGVDAALGVLGKLGALSVVLDDPALELETAYAVGRVPGWQRLGPWDGDRASAPGLRRVIGHDGATPGPDDLGRADLVVLLGVGRALPEGALKLLEQAHGRGARLFEIRLGDDPPALAEGLAEVRMRLAPRARLELLEALAGGLFDEDWHRPDVLHQATAGWEVLRGLTTLRAMARLRENHVDTPGVRALLEALARAERQLFVWGPAWVAGEGQAAEPSEVVAACARLALLSEAVGRPGTGLLPLPTHPAEPCLTALGGPWSGPASDAGTLLCVGGDPRGRAPLGAASRERLAGAARRVHLGPVLDQASVAAGGGEVWCLPTSSAAEQRAPGARVGALRAVIAPRSGDAAPRGDARPALHWLRQTAAGGELPDDLEDLHPALAASRPALAPLATLAPGEIFRWGGERLGERRHFPTPDGRAWLDPRPRPPETPGP